MSLYCGRPESSQIPSDPSNVVSFYAVGISGGIRVVMRMPPTNPEAVAYTILYRRQYWSTECRRGPTPRCLLRSPRGRPNPCAH